MGEITGEPEPIKRLGELSEQERAIILADEREVRGMSADEEVLLEDMVVSMRRVLAAWPDCLNGMTLTAIDGVERTVTRRLGSV